MFGKLFKYEWKAMMKTMLPIYGAALVLAVINGFLFQTIFGDWIEEFSLFHHMRMAAMSLYMLVLGAMGVFTVVMIIQRFYKGLLKQEGYLMFTLPVKTWKLIFSKACVSFTASVCSTIVAMLSLGLFGGMDFLKVLIVMPGRIIELVREGYSMDPELCIHLMVFMLEIILGLIVKGFASIYELYFAMALGQMSKNHKVVCSILWFIVMNTVMSFVGMLLLGAGISLMDVMDTSEEMFKNIHAVGLQMLAVQAISLTVFMAGTGYVLDRKLNLE